jgi:hypothetical protein
MKCEGDNGSLEGDREYSPSRIDDMDKKFWPENLFGGDDFRDVEQIGG